MFKSVLVSLLMACVTTAQAENLANLIVLNDVQTGIWTIANEGVANSPIFLKSTETLCVTRAQIIKNFSHGLVTNTKTGQETYPTVLTLNTASIGVAEVNFPAQQIGTIAIPASSMNYTIKRVQSNKWVLSMGSSTSKVKFTTTATYQGEKTASCGGKMEADEREEVASKADSKIKFRDTDNSCKDYPYLLKAIPKFSAYGGYTFDRAECKVYKDRFDSKDISQVSLAIHYKNIAEKTKMFIGFTDYLNNKKKLGVNIQIEKFNNPNKADDVAQSNLATLDYPMTAFGQVSGHPDYTSRDFEHGIRYAQYSGNYKERYNLIVDIYGRQLMNSDDVDNFIKEYLEAFKLGELK